MKMAELELTYKDGRKASVVFDTEKPNGWKEIVQKGLVEATVIFPIKITVPINDNLLRQPAPKGKQSRAIAAIPIRHTLSDKKALGWVGYMVDIKEVLPASKEVRTVACEVGYIKNKKGDAVFMRVWMGSGYVQVYEDNVKKKKLNMDAFNLGGLL